jgi:ElaB/YqjD/DUF883 family membrane-anchored ribosome-binding protein
LAVKGELFTTQKEHHTMSDEDITAILNKVKKLFALSASSNPNEAAAAAAKAQSLVMQYNLSMSQVTTTTNEEQAPPVYGTMPVETSTRVWKRTLLHVVATTNFCTTTYRPGSPQSTLIGQSHNREVVVQMYHSLVTQLEPMARHAYAENDSSTNATRWMDSFYKGAVRSIFQRLVQEKRAMTTASSACRALVVQTDQHLQEAVHRFFPQIRKAPQTRSRATDGYDAGREAGNRVTFQQAIAHTPNS